MADTATIRQPEFRAAYRANEQKERIRSGKVASALVLVLMPFGWSLDLLVYREHKWSFLWLRLFCSVLAGVLWYLHTTPLGEKRYKLFGLPIAYLPAVFINVMIFLTEGPDSPYYAGLNLIVLAVSVVVRWSVWESLAAVAGIMLMYGAACLAYLLKHGSMGSPGIFGSNLVFMIETGAIVVVGNYFFNRLHFEQFALRYELDANRKKLEQTNEKLDTQNKELADTVKKLTEAELQLVQQEKMASLGVMSAGIIHEINNPLNYAATGLYTLRQKGKYIAADQQADFEDILKDVEDGVTRVKTIVSDLRTFSHPETESRDPVLVADVVESALRFLSSEWRDKVNIQQNLESQQTILANHNKLVHVVLNLLQNSLDALSGKKFQNEPATIWIEGRVENGLSRLVIRDNGPGIASEHLDKIFDPFFTTKDVGEGMGLGLSICYRIVQDYDGRIAVRTEPGKFCEFALEFPVKG